MQSRLLLLLISACCVSSSGCDMGASRQQAARLAADEAQLAEKAALVEQAKKQAEAAKLDPQAEKAAQALTRAGARLEQATNKPVVGADLRGIEVNDELAVMLSQLARLEKLSIDKSVMTLAGWQQLAKLTHLQQLDLRDCPLDNEQLTAAVNGMPKLKAIRLSGKSGSTTVDDSGLAVVSKCPDLRVLAIDDLWITTAGLQPISNCSKLQELYAGGTPIDDEAAKEIVKLPSLKKLRLSRTGIGVAAIETLSKLPLEDLDVSEASGINDETMLAISQMKTLKRLNLWRDTVSEVGAAHLVGLTALEWLNLDNTHINDEAMPYLSGLTKLTFLHLGSTAVTDAGMHHLATLKALKDLKVTRTAVTDEGVQVLKDAIPGIAIQLKYIEGE